MHAFADAIPLELGNRASRCSCRRPGGVFVSMPSFRLTNAIPKGGQFLDAGYVVQVALRRSTRHDGWRSDGGATVRSIVVVVM
jgi:hypothetical protein